MIRDAILTATIVIIFFLIDNQPRPVKVVQTDYCVINKRVAGKDEKGEWRFGWAPMYAPCSEQPDIYREI